MQIINKYSIKRLAGVFVGAVVICAQYSCNKFLDVRPNSQIKQDDLFSSKQGFQDALTGMYTQLTHRSLYGENMTFGFMDVLAQYYEAGSNNDHIFYRSANFDYTDAGVKSRLASIWGDMYNNIANDNNLLAHIDAKRNLFSAVDFNLIKGEALGLRAFMHFDLLRAYGPVYLTGASKPAIPYVTELSKDPKIILSANVVLDSIIGDLERASELLGVYKDMDKISAPNLSSGDLMLSYRQNHFNYWAAKALLARVYLYKGDKPKALAAAQEVINSGEFSFVNQSNLTGSSFMKNRTFSMEHIFSLSDFSLSDPVDYYFKGAANQAVRLTMTTTVRDQIFEVASGGTSDYRYAFLWETDQGTLYPSKLWQQSDVVDSLKNLLPLVTLPEMYYIAAESSPQSADAIKLLNAVRQHRAVLDLPESLDPTQLQNEIFKAYQKELFLEGQLFFYYKRLNLEHIERTSVAGSDKVYVFPLPDNELQFGDQTTN